MGEVEPDGRLHVGHAGLALCAVREPDQVGLGPAVRGEQQPERAARGDEPVAIAVEVKALGPRPLVRGQPAPEPRQGRLEPRQIQAPDVYRAIIARQSRAFRGTGTIGGGRRPLGARRVASIRSASPARVGDSKMERIGRST